MQRVMSRDFVRIGGNGGYPLIILNHGEANRHSVLQVVKRFWPCGGLKVLADGAANLLHDMHNSGDVVSLPTAVVGDLDSASPSSLQYFQRLGVNIVKVDDQDTTDFTKAINHVLSIGCGDCKEVLVIGGSGGRIDHLFGIIQSLYLARQITNINMTVLLADSLVAVLSAGEHSVTVPVGVTCGIVPIGHPVSSITTHGLEWDLKKLMSGWNLGNIRGVFQNAGAVQNVLQNVANAARNVWTDFRSESKPFEVVALTHDQLHNNFVVIQHPPGQMFGLYQDPKKNYHIVMLHSATKSHYTMYSSPDKDLTLRMRDDMQQIHELFALISATNSNETEKLLESVHRTSGLRVRWSSVHHACHVGLAAPLKRIHNYAIQASSPTEDGYLCMNLACTGGHTDIVQILLAANISAGLKDIQGRNAFHSAALGSAGVFKTLVSKAHSNVNELDNDGYTPLALAIIALRADTAAALLDCGASTTVLCHKKNALEIAASLPHDDSVLKIVDLLMQKNPKLLKIQNEATGNTALHSCSSKPLLNALLKNTDLVGELVNVCNKQGQSALHVCAGSGTVPNMVVLMAAGANFDQLDAEGNTPLHVAALHGHIVAVKALLVFGAKPLVKNTVGIMPIDITKSGVVRSLFIEFQSAASLGASVKTARSTLIQFNLKGAVNNVQALVKKGGKRPLKLLTLDGGGIKGLIEVQILLAIEERLKRPLWPEVDWVAGTSTGSILALALATGQSLRDIQRMYFQFKDIVFQGSRIYDHGPLEKFLKHHLGHSKTMKDIAKPKLFIPAVKADKTPTSLYVFRNYNLPGSHELNEEMGFLDTRDQLLWKVARASSAAPTYFNKAEGNLVDGGLMANNPCLDLLTDVQIYNQVLHMQESGSEVRPMGCVISIGCGVMPEKNIDNMADMPWTSKPGQGWVETIKQLPASALAAKSLAEMLIGHIAAADGRPVDRCRALCSSQSAPFFRLSPPLNQEIALDTKDDALLVEALWDTQLYVRSQSKTLDSIEQLFNLLI